MNLKYLLIIIQSKSDIQWHILDSSYINFINQIVIVKIIKLCDHDSFVPNITLLGLESIMNTPNITIYLIIIIINIFYKNLHIFALSSR